MFCPHCQAFRTYDRPFDHPLEGGVAYAQTCATCGHVVAVRPHIDADPPIVPPYLTRREAAHLLFVRWRLNDECRSQTERSFYPPMLRAA